jgi:hypothetical protein
MWSLWRVWLVNARDVKYAAPLRPLPDDVVDLDHFRVEHGLTG